MTRKQVAKLNAYLAIVIVTDAANSIWNLLVAFVSSYGAFVSEIGVIEDSMEAQERIITGYTSDKKQKRLTMTDMAMKIKGAVQAFASGTDQALYDSVKYSRSKILYGSSVGAEVKSQIIHDVAAGIIGSLANFGVVALDLTNFQTAITEYHDVISMPKAQKDIVKTATAAIKQGLKDADGILQTKLNNLMENFRSSAATFYSNFFNAERIDNAPTSFTEIRSEIKNNNTDEFLQGVVMTITGGTKVYIATSNESGIADKKKVKPNIDYTVTYELPNFQPLSLNVAKLSPGELREIAVKMIPV